MDLRPHVSLDDRIVRDNARAWQTRRARPVWAVVKSDGYGWGRQRLVRVLDDVVEGFCVADAGEFEQIRRLSRRPVIIFSEPPLEEIGAICRRDGYPNITTVAALRRVAAEAESAGRPFRVRLGLAPAVTWFGIAVDEISAFIEASRTPWLEIELWSQLTAPDAENEERRNFARFVAAFRDAGIPIAAIDLESSAPAARGKTEYARLRLGAGLFGAFASAIPGVQCAIRVDAVCVDEQPSHADLRIGYLRRAAPDSGCLAICRIGYGDGLPRGFAGAQLKAGTVVNIGMQYCVLAIPAESANLDRREKSISFFSAGADLTQITASSAIAATDLIVNLGLANRAREAQPEHLT